MQIPMVNFDQPNPCRFLILPAGIVWMLLGLTLGCSIEKTAATMDGDTTNVRAGQGTAMVAGVEIMVEDLKQTSSGISSGTQISERADGVTETETRRVTLGEVEVTLMRTDDGPLTLQVGKQDYGYVESGDRILIDGQRRLFVNGAERTPAEAPAGDDDIDSPAAASDHSFATD